MDKPEPPHSLIYCLRVDLHPLYGQNHPRGKQGESMWEIRRQLKPSLLADFSESGGLRGDLQEFMAGFSLPLHPPYNWDTGFLIYWEV